MFDTLLGLWNLRWRQPQPKVRPLPPHIDRTFVDTLGGPLELLVCEPCEKQDGAPVLFVHGGSGSAGVWLEWMSYLREPYSSSLYAISVRVWGFTLEDFASDLEAAMSEVKRREGAWPILICHSAGSTIAQRFLASGRIQASGLVLAGAIPHYGIGRPLFQWWTKIDWTMPLRALVHLQHPRSPLSTTTLVHNAFFSKGCPRERVKKFEYWMADLESMRWPLAALGGWQGLSGGSWLKPEDIVRNMTGCNVGNDEILVILGTEDHIICGTHERTVMELEAAVRRLRNSSEHSKLPGQGVKLVEIPDTGHHLQNDLKWDDAARAVATFLERL
jgi:pimeloyl-ACP methyl ester carboxylesterase